MFNIYESPPVFIAFSERRRRSFAKMFAAFLSLSCRDESLMDGTDRPIIKPMIRTIIRASVSEYALRVLKRESILHYRSINLKVASYSQKNSKLVKSCQ